MNNIKYYDRTIYEIDKKIKIELLIFVIFTISFLFGYLMGNLEISTKENQINQSQIELNNLEDTTRRYK